MPPPYNEMIPPGAPSLLAKEAFYLLRFWVKPF